jgi:ubiquinone/menaquinone biosynthesis C-methylase UbiE
VPPPPGPTTRREALPTDASGLIDAEALVERYTVEELSESADRYFARLVNWDYHLAKPLTTPDESPILLAHFSACLGALRAEPGMTVLDFGSGSCWTTRWLTQIGYAAIACDVSAHALAIGEELFRRLPVIGDRPAPQFVHFDGRRLPLPDESVHRVLCIDAFHHVPNRPTVLAELHRVLRPGGRAVLAEGGPVHSRLPQSQDEMRDHVVVERDIHVDVLEAEARAAGFADVLVAIYASIPNLVPAARYHAELADGTIVADASRRFHHNHTLLVLERSGVEEATSASPHGLAGRIEITGCDGRRLHVRLTNTGTSRWLGTAHTIGRVALGLQAVDATGRLVDAELLRVQLATDPAATVAPGASVDVVVDLPDPPPDTQLRLDLVSEMVAWFSNLGSAPVPVPLA